MAEDKSYDSKISAQREPSVEFATDIRAVERTGGWISAACLICSTTTLPTLLSLPYALANLSWIPGIIVMVISSVGAYYCFRRLVQLNNFGGVRHYTYPELATFITGSHAFGVSVRWLQFTVQWGVGIANILMASAFCDYMWDYSCSESTCDTMTATYWTLVCCGGLVAIGQMPDLTERKLFLALSGFSTVFYTTVGIVLSFTNSQASTASYALVGSTATQWFNALNAVGIVFFLFGDSCYPELQSYLKPNENNSTIDTMLRGMALAFGITIPTCLLLAVSGYYAFGNTVGVYLFNASMSPRWLTSFVAIVCIVQLIFSTQVFAQPNYNYFEPLIMRRWPKATWMQKKVQKRRDEDEVAEEGKPARAEAVPSFLFKTLYRVFYAGTIAIVAVFIPFFSSIMGILGAFILTPLTYLYPLTLYLIANKDKIGKLDKWFHVGLIVMFLLGGSAAAVGAIRSLVVDFDTFTLG